MVTQVALAERLDTAASDPLREALLAAQNNDVKLDGRSVEHLGAACVELLMSAEVLWKSSGHQITIQNTSHQMAQDLASLGVTPDSFLKGSK